MWEGSLEELKLDSDLGLWARAWLCHCSPTRRWCQQSQYSCLQNGVAIPRSQSNHEDRMGT